MTKVDQLIEKFKEFQEELNKACPCEGKTKCPASCPCPSSCKCKGGLKKNVNNSYSPAPNATTGTSGGEGGMYRSEDAAKAEAGKHPKVMTAKKPIAPKDVEDAGPASFKITTPKDNKLATSSRHPMKKGDPIMDSMTMSETEKAEANPKFKKPGKSGGGGAPANPLPPSRPPELIKFKNNKQWSLDKVDPEENVNIPHPQGKAKMAIGVNKGEGTNRAIADPKQSKDEDARGKVHMVKEDKIMPMEPEKESPKAKVTGLPYNGEDKNMHKGEKVRVGTGNNDENKAPGRHSGYGY